MLSKRDEAFCKSQKEKALRKAKQLLDSETEFLRILDIYMKNIK